MVEKVTNKLQHFEGLVEDGEVPTFWVISSNNELKIKKLNAPMRMKRSYAF